MSTFALIMKYTEHGQVEVQVQTIAPPVTLFKQVFTPTNEVVSVNLSIPTTWLGNEQ